MSKHVRFLALSAAGLILAASPAAQAQSVISGSYYELTLGDTCNNVINCNLTFPVLDASLAGQIITFTEISCQTTVTAGMADAQLVITDNGVNPRRPHYVTVVRSAGRASFRDPLEMKVAGGPPRQMRLMMTAQGSSATISAVCTLVGRISAS